MLINWGAHYNDHMLGRCDDVGCARGNQTRPNDAVEHLLCTGLIKRESTRVHLVNGTGVDVVEPDLETTLGKRKAQG